MLIAVQDLVPMLLPLLAGYLLARFAGLSPAPLRTTLRFVFFPALLLLLLLLSPTINVTHAFFWKMAAIGASMAGLGLIMVSSSPRYLKSSVDAAAAFPAIATVTIPMMMLAWGSPALGTLCALFVGSTLTIAIYQGRFSAIKTLLKEPWALVVAGAIVLRTMGISLPADITSGVDRLANASYVVLALFVGTMMYPLGEMGHASAWRTVGTRLAAGLGLAILAIKFIGPFSASVESAILLAAVAPPATRELSLTEIGDDSLEGQAAVKLGIIGSLVAVLVMMVVEW